MRGQSQAGQQGEADEREDVPGAQALLKGLDILLAIGSAPGPLRFGDIEKAVAMPRASLHRLLAALASRNLVRYDPRKRRYEVGTRVLELSRRTLDRSEVIRAAKPEMARLARLLKRTICLMVLDRNEVFVLDFEDADPSYGRLVRLWPRLPLLGSAAGRAMLAALPRDQAIERITAAANGAPPETRTMAEIDIGKALGYAVFLAEPASGRPSAAAALLDEKRLPGGSHDLPFRERLRLARGSARDRRLLADGARRASRQIGIGPETPFVVRRPEAPADPRVEALPTGRDFVGENPLWDEARQRLFWVDVLAPALRWWAPATRDAGRLELPGVTAGLALDGEGRLVACGQGALASSIRSRDAAPACSIPRASRTTGSTRPVSIPRAASGLRPWRLTTASAAAHSGAYQRSTAHAATVPRSACRRTPSSRRMADGSTSPTRACRASAASPSIRRAATWARSASFSRPIPPAAGRTASRWIARAASG